MERGTLKSIGKTLDRFKYPALILLLGTALLLWPTKQKEKVTPPVEQKQEASVEERMEEILSCVEGAGKVRVLLTRSTGDETVYQTDLTESSSADGAKNQTVSTVLASGDAPVVKKIVYGQYQGAVVVCEGADRARVRLELVNAVAGLTGLSADRITVIKMKS